MNIKNGLFKNIIIAVLCSFGVFLLMSYLAPGILFGRLLPYPAGLQKPQNNTNIAIPKTQGVSNITAVAEKVMPAVVGIVTIDVSDNFFNKTQEQEGTGSGFIINSNGYILTNNHVASTTSSKVTVYLADGKVLPAKVLWSDSKLDLSIVKINATGLPYVNLGDSDNTQVGETVVAIGNPLGLRFERSVTSGIISAKNRSVMVSEDSTKNILEDLFQTDASINPGNSGGPLLNTQGYVIGINSAKITSAEGLGFAIPINITKPIIDKIIKTGTFKSTYLGIVAYDKEIAGYFIDDINIQSGVYVADIDPSGPAYAAGIRKGDIIKSVDGKPINTMLQLKHVLFTKNPGDVIKVTTDKATVNVKLK